MNTRDDPKRPHSTYIFKEIILHFVWFCYNDSQITIYFNLKFKDFFENCILSKTVLLIKIFSYYCGVFQNVFKRNKAKKKYVGKL